jgi:DDE superfamily endonuclease
MQTSLLPYDPRSPVVGFEEACTQVFGEVRPVQRTRPRRPTRIDEAYERKGVCHQLMRCEPLRGWRHVTVSARRTRRDYAACVRELVDMHSPQAKQMRLGQDNLHTHDGASLYEAFPPAAARRILDKIDVHYPPKPGSGLHRAETEINIMQSQCLNRRLDNQPLRAAEVAAWEQKRHRATARLHWTFTLATARRKLRKLYPSIDV